jgi:hypothetical protein
MINKIKSVYRFLSPKFQSVHLEYKVTPKPRYGHGLPPHSLLNNIINSDRGTYKKMLESFSKYENNISIIKDGKDETNADNPTWNNEYLPGLDIIGLYGMVSEFKPKHYIEVGSGNSTKVARKAITENNLSTKITSIDPFPRANIDHLADKVIRMPFENLENYSILFDNLNANDILFIDNSHRLFPNSDVMIFFLEILPFLKKDVVVHIHDIYLPYDYPQFMCDRFYNEQYMLAAMLIANPSKYEILLPLYFISQDNELQKSIEHFWKNKNLQNVEKHGGSFWFKIK